MLSILKRNNFFLFDCFMFAFISSISLQLLTTHLLVQDKICRNVYNQTKFVCQNINKDIFHGQEQLDKDKVLADTALYQNYSNLIILLPMFVYSLFVGSFLDRYPGSTKLIAIWLNFMQILTSIFYLLNAKFFSLSPYLLLMSGLFVYLSGGMTTFLTLSHRYIVCNTDPENRSLRFTIYQIYLVVAFAMGSLLSANTLVMVDNLVQLRNYDLNYYIAMTIQIVTLVMVSLIRIDRKEETMMIIENPPNGNGNIPEVKIITGPGKPGSEPEVKITEPEKSGPDPKVKRNLLATFFELDNVRATFRCLVKPRQNRVRGQVILLTVLLFIFFSIYMGLDTVFLSFSQKVYQFDAKTFSMVSAYAKIVPNIGLAVGSYILLKWLKLSDGTVIAMSITAGITSQILIGTFTLVPVYLGSLVIGSLFGLASIVMKTKLSKLVAEDEIGKIFSIVSTLESAAPLLGTLLFTTIFSATISTYPSLIYHVAAMITLMCLVAAIYEELYLSKPVNPNAPTGLNHPPA